MYFMQRSGISNAPLLTHLDHLTHFVLLRFCINFAPSIRENDARRLKINCKLFNDSKRRHFPSTLYFRHNEKNERKEKLRETSSSSLWWKVVFSFLFSFLSKQKHMMSNLLLPFSFSVSASGLTSFHRCSRCRWHSNIIPNIQNACEKCETFE